MGINLWLMVAVCAELAILYIHVEIWRLLPTLELSMKHEVAWFVMGFTPIVLTFFKHNLYRKKHCKILKKDVAVILGLGTIAAAFWGPVCGFLILMPPAEED